MELTDSIKTLLIATAKALKGSARRLFMARTVKEHPIVSLVTATYASGVRLSKDAMEALEAQIMRLPGLEKWFVDIFPATLAGQTG